MTHSPHSPVIRAATALVLFAILVIVTLLQQRYFAGRITYDLS